MPLTLTLTLPRCGPHVVLALLFAALPLNGSSAQRQDAARAVPPVDRFFTSGGLRLHYLDWGGAGRPPLVLIHGLDRTAHTFDHLAPHFTSRYHVIALEMRGHGDSDWDPAARYLVEDHARDLEALVEQLDLRDVVLWGNSTGGRVVQVYAGMHPERVSRVVAEDVGPERPRQIADSYARRVEQESQGWSDAEELIAQLRKTNPRMPEANIRTWVRSGTRLREDGRLVWKRDPNLSKGFVATDLWRFVGRIEAPILYVLGGASSIVAPDTQERLRTTLPRLQIVTMPGLGHYPSDERPAELLAIVDRFLEEGRQ
jgi:pimeloyl-ACP methyl ester carboxylesterase